MAVTDADSDVVTVKWPLSALLRPLRSAGADGGRAASQAAVRAFERLAGALRRLRDLPLAVTDVQPIAAACRYTAEPPPKPLGAGVAPPVGAEPLRFVISLEGSGKWPTDADAVDAVRSALHVRICEKLREASGTGGFGPGEPPDAIVASADGIDILLDGFALRGSITYDEVGGSLDEEQKQLDDESDALRALMGSRGFSKGPLKRTAAF
ncbi:Nrap protein-domain-containing protein [Pavlovales sp. CCMP2436]|nr:Nrap protein-domain-containing protein [Pavlovales sp. CCMP2436]